MFIVIVYYIIFAITLVYGIYFLATGIVGLLKKPRKINKDVHNDNFFAILIPARNEEKVIGNLVDSLKNENYPQGKYKIYVIVNNCTDHTKEIALEHGAEVLECNKKTKTKGDVLKFAFQELKDEKRIDAYLIFDADNVIHPDFLKNMNIYLENGYRVAEGYRDAKNPSDNWLSGSYSLFYLFQNIFFNKARMGLNGSASINGTGFMIKKSLIDEEGFNTYTLTEDVEFTGQCALKNEPIAFVEDAITYDEYPCRFNMSWKQRKRWSAGIMQCRKLYSWKLLKNYFKTGNIASLDMSLIYWGPIMQLLGFLGLITLLIFRMCGIHLNDVFSYFFAWGWLYFIITYVVSIIVEVIMLRYKKKNPQDVISGLLLFLLFIFTWIPINAICLIKKHTKWEEISHDRNVKIDEIVR